MLLTPLLVGNSAPLSFVSQCLCHFFSCLFFIFHLLIAASHPSTQAPPDRQVQLCHPLKTAKTSQDKRERERDRKEEEKRKAVFFVCFIVVFFLFCWGQEGTGSTALYFLLPSPHSQKNKTHDSWTSTTETSVVKRSQGADAHVPVTYASSRWGRMGG